MISRRSVLRLRPSPEAGERTYKRPFFVRQIAGVSFDSLREFLLPRTVFFLSTCLLVTIKAEVSKHALSPFAAANLAPGRDWLRHPWAGPWHGAAQGSSGKSWSAGRNRTSACLPSFGYQKSAGQPVYAPFPRICPHARYVWRKRYPYSRFRQRNRLPIYPRPKGDIGCSDVLCQNSRP